MKEQTKNDIQASFLFKQKSFDFIVEEQLPFSLSGKGDAFYVYFEKQNKTTMEILDFLCKELHISRLTLGVAGLKDKDAITRQWISLYKSALQKIGGEEVFLNTLARVAKIITTKYHTRPLQMTDPIKNQFSIRLRASHHLGQGILAKAESNIVKYLKEGVPNFFGTQRFGINGKNRELGKAVLEKKTSFKDKFEQKFKIQAYSSWLFNQYLKDRLPLGQDPLDGELISTSQGTGVYQKKENTVTLVSNTLNKEIGLDTAKLGTTVLPFDSKMFPVCPVRGWNTLISQPTTQAGILQQAFMKKHMLDQKYILLFKPFNVYGTLRPIWAKPTESLLRFQGQDILLQFTLDSGMYASILIYNILDHLES